MTIYILVHTAFGSWESEFCVDGVFSSMEEANATKLIIKNELPRFIDTCDGRIDPHTTFEIRKHKLNEEFDDFKLSYWDME
ncbi:hypothetical protein 8014-B2_00111 [Lactobacillus phage ATCC 8014-B2]|uniref:Uncharacterized protein n=1 Tax=Lactobacillus phage ATCC 8014-B2 TaxID=1225795 RepID=K4I0L3_9CAUD|nr:hypothetical protein HOQ89_gp035 [Lactobacillus phage ATCC 8014-B2]AFU63178.1 hypothetical protein 8014-B2_00111 [Lactobacillus phage ATCC 8014-B2]